ncbi:hypothetical protein ANO11243_012490 [Dothideomycetidae sp. 11243]|nr:hypothetical protein ANO11243_012490 [fungal sp. No.11243]
MSTTDPAPRQRSTSRTRRPPTRPTTPLRPPSRTSLRASTSTTPQSSSLSSTSHPLDALEPAFGELSDGIADLEANMLHLSLLHDSVSRFNQHFAAFLYGLNMSAFCIDFPEAPGPDAVRRFAAKYRQNAAREEAETPRRRGGGGADRDVDNTFLTTDTSFVNDPPASVRAARFAPAPPPAAAAAAAQGKAPAGRGRGTASSTRGSGIGRGRARGVR